MRRAAMKLLVAILTLCTSLPIWYYLLYQVLSRVEASELMWFLFWIYMPVGVVSGIMAKVLEE